MSRCNWGVIVQCGNEASKSVEEKKSYKRQTLALRVAQPRTNLPQDSCLITVSNSKYRNNIMYPFVNQQPKWRTSQIYSSE